MWKIAFKNFEVIWSAEAEHITSNFLKAVFHKFHLVHSWKLCSIFHFTYPIFHNPYYITNFEGSKIDIATSRFSICQIVNIPPHVLNNTSSCIDLIFISQPNLVMHSDVDPFLYPNCNHQIVFSKFNLKIPYLPHMNA